MPPDARRILKKIRETVISSAPGATEHFSYGIPGFRFDGKTLVWYAGWKQHVSLLGSGERLFDNVGTDLHGLELTRTVAAPGVTHLKFVKRWYSEF